MALESIFHSPCAFNPHGVSKSVCDRMTRTVQKNLDGCCASNCTSPLRVCKVCVVKVASPNTVVNVNTGLCELHANQSTAVVQPPTLNREVRLPLTPRISSERPKAPPVQTSRAVVVPKPSLKPKTKKQVKVVVAVTKMPAASTSRSAPVMIPKASSAPVVSHRAVKSFGRPASPEVLKYIVSGFTDDVTKCIKLIDEILVERRVLVEKERCSLTNTMLIQVTEHSLLLRQKLAEAVLHLGIL